MTFQCSLDGAAFATCPAGYTGLAQGAHTFQVRARDAAGNVDASPDSRSWTVDTSVPTTTIATGPTGAGELDQRDVHVHLQRGRRDLPVLARRRRLRRLPGELHRARAGRAHVPGPRHATPPATSTPRPTPRSWTVDTIAPDITITGGPTGAVSSTSATFTFSSSEAGVTLPMLARRRRLRCLPGRLHRAVAGRAHFPGPRAGRRRSTRAAPATRNWTVDTSVPTTTITGGPSGPVNSTTAAFTFTSNEGGVTFQCSLDNAAFGACPASYTGLSQGAHTFAGPRPGRRRQRRRYRPTPGPGPSTPSRRTRR